MADNSAAVQLINSIVSQLSKSEGLQASLTRQASAALLNVQPAIRGCGTQQPDKLHDVFHSLVDSIIKRISKGVLQEQALAIQVLSACIRVCDPVSLLQQAVSWGTLLGEALRKAAAAVVQQQQPQADATPPAAAAAAAAAPVGVYAVIQSSCAAAAELFNRLQQYIELPAVRREVSGMVPKLLQPLLSVLDNSNILESTAAPALQLTAALLRCVPNNLRPAANQVERLLQQLVLRTAASAAGTGVATAGSSTFRQGVLAEAALCAALLPAAPGDAAAWSDAARKLIVSCHDVLDHLLMGLEGRPVDVQYRSYLNAAPAQQQQQSAAAEGAWFQQLPWQHQEQQQSAAAARRDAPPAALLVSFCSTALQHLLQQPCAVPVPVPSYSLALLAARLVRFDAAAAVAAGAVPKYSTMYQELLLLQPQLQVAGWQLLQQVVQRCGQQLQLQGLLLRLVRQGLRSVQVSGPAALQHQPLGVRCCTYNTAALLLQTAGLAGARALAAEAMGCVALELYGHTAAAGAGATGGQAGAGSTQQRPTKRARKSGGAAGGELGQFDPAAAVAAAGAVEATRLASASAADLQAQVAVLGVLRALLSAGGQLLPAEVRSHADAIAYHMSASAAQLAMQLEQQPGLSTAAAAAGPGGALTALHVAALEALLVSMLVPCGHRPPFLSQAVLLFRQGRSSSNASVAAVCEAASVQVEVLLHPRAAAMGGVRQYTGMEAVPALAKPRMWGVFDTQQPVSSEIAATTGSRAVHMNGVQQAGTLAVQDGGIHSSSLPAAGANAVAAAAGPSVGGHVVMGYPVNSQSAPPGPQQQQQQQHQQAPALQHLAPAGASVPLDIAGNAAPPAALQQVDHNEDRIQQPLARADAQHQQHRSQAQQGQQQEQQPAPLWAPAKQQDDSVVGVVPVVAAAAAARGVKAAAAPVFENESSDSEGPLPDIDSGDSSADEESDE